MKSDQNKIYYDVNIPYKVEEKDSRHHFYSKAQTEIRLNGPLMTNVQDYDLAISKFKVDTESLPVFIPELKHPQSQDESVFLPTGEVISDYTVTAYFPKMLDPKHKWAFKRYDPHDWTDVPAGHVRDENTYEYNEGNTQFRGREIHPRDWVNANDAAIKRELYAHLYTVKLEDGYTHYNLKDLQTRQWTPIPPYHTKNMFIYEYWDYDGHNDYRRRLYDDWTVDNVGVKEIPEGHVYDTNIYNYFYEGAPEDNPEVVCLKQYIPDWEAIDVQHEYNEELYQYDDETVFVTEVIGLKFYPDNWTRTPEGHVRDLIRFEYIEEQKGEYYKSLFPLFPPYDWEPVPPDHVHDPTEYEYEMRDIDYQYKGKDYKADYPDWSIKADVQGVLRFTDEEMERCFLIRKRYNGQYKGRFKTPEDYEDYLHYAEKTVGGQVNANYVIMDPDVYSFRPVDQLADKNNGFVYDCVSENVTFFKNEGGPTTHDEKFWNRNEFLKINYSGYEHPENTNEEYFQYDYQSVLDRINVCIERVLGKLTDYDGVHFPTSYLTYNETLNAAFFKLDGDKIVFYLWGDFLHKNILLKFSGNLYKYIGNGFKCRFYNNPGSGLDEVSNDGSFFIDYNPFAWRHAVQKQNNGKPEPFDTDQFNVVTAHDKWVERNLAQTFFTCPVDFMYTNEINSLSVSNVQGNERSYLSIYQQYSTLSNWNVCKCILICSSSFPIKAEYYPTLNKNMTLTHYKEDWYINLVQGVYGESAYNDEQQIFDKASTKILDVYYPVSATGGDIRSSIIYSNDNIEGGNKIDMIGGMDLENFDVKVKWVDIYGNVYDLYIAPGCSVSIRFCFTRKKILKEELLSAFDTLKRHLEIISDHYVPKEDMNDAFTAKYEPRPKKPKGGKFKVELPGVLENGLIVKP